jgi:hypothetical protein
MIPEPGTIRIFIPLTIKRRNGRPRIVPPEHIEEMDAPTAAPHVLRAIARAWGWRRRLERGEATTIQDIATAENVSVCFVGRMLHLTYLAPNVLEQLVAHRRPCALSLRELATTAMLPWTDQDKAVFGA